MNPVYILSLEIMFTFVNSPKRVLTDHSREHLSFFAKILQNLKVTQLLIG